MRIEINRQFIGHKKAEELKRRIASILLHFGPACVSNNKQQELLNGAENERKTIKSTNFSDCMYAPRRE